MSTGLIRADTEVVDNSSTSLWLGCVVPKRYAGRAVTRNLLRRQIRGAFDRHGPGLPRGMWLVRLREPFATKLFVSAASSALTQAVRSELDALLSRAVR